RDPAATKRTTICSHSWSSAGALRCKASSQRETSERHRKTRSTGGQAMSLEPFLGELQLFSFNFAPRGWAFCAGQLLSISQNHALFSILGTTYGGNGTTNFALPDLRSRITVGQGPGYVIGEAAGQETHVLTTEEMPSHIHPVNAVANGQSGGTNVPGGS